MPRPARRPRPATPAPAAPRAARAAAVLADPRWARVVARDPAATGFVFAVRTTGVFCRPACGARAPRPENVEFFADAPAAERAGYRACLRCRPRGLAAAEARGPLVVAVCSFLEAAERPPTAAALAARFGRGARALAAEFRQVTGLTPRAFAEQARAARLREALHADGAVTPAHPGGRVTRALHAAGYGSTSRLHAAAPGALGMAPSRYAARGAGETLRHGVARSSLGLVLAAATERGVAAVLLGDDAAALLADLRRRFARATLVPGDAAFAATLRRVVAAVEAPAEPCALPLDLHGTLFQRRVWEALRGVTAGASTSYGALARSLGAPRAVRAVAGACAANPVAVLVPCHRVVAADGALTGYRWGLERKRELRRREQGR